MTVASKRGSNGGGREGGPLIDVIMPLIPCSSASITAANTLRRRTPFKSFPISTPLLFSFLPPLRRHRVRQSIGREWVERACSYFQETSHGATEVKCDHRPHVRVNVGNQAAQNGAGPGRLDEKGFQRRKPRVDTVLMQLAIEYTGDRVESALPDTYGIQQVVIL